VLELEPDLARIPTAMVGVIGAYPPGSAHDYEMRTFAPGVGVPEDPVCGSMNASVGQWLTGTGAAPAEYRVSQGARLGRAGEISVVAEPDGSVWVGGATTTCFEGVATL
jgi:PhzF family phenazine biosynthesis protein